MIDHRHGVRAEEFRDNDNLFDQLFSEGKNADVGVDFLLLNVSSGLDSVAQVEVVEVAILQIERFIVLISRVDHAVYHRNRKGELDGR